MCPHPLCCGIYRPACALTNFGAANAEGVRFSAKGGCASGAELTGRARRHGFLPIIYSNAEEVGLEPTGPVKVTAFQAVAMATMRLLRAGNKICFLLWAVGGEGSAHKFQDEEKVG